MVSTHYPRLWALMRSSLAFLAVVALMGLPLTASSDPADSAKTASESAVQGLSLEEVLAKHYEASGGDRFQEVQTVKMTGTSVVMGMEAPYARYAKRPDKMLLEIYVQNMTGVQAYDGEIAWWFMPFMGHAAAEQMPPDMAQAAIEGSDFDSPLIDPEAKGHSVKLLGLEPIAGGEAYKVEVTMASGGVQMHYVDTESFYTVRVDSAEGQSWFKQYEMVDGFPVPRVIEMISSMGEQTVWVETIEFDIELDDAAFSMH